LSLDPELQRLLEAMDGDGPPAHEVPVDQAIPRSLFAPVAKLLRWAQGVE